MLKQSETIEEVKKPNVTSSDLMLLAKIEAKKEQEKAELREREESDARRRRLGTDQRRLDFLYRVTEGLYGLLGAAILLASVILAEKGSGKDANNTAFYWAIVLTVVSAIFTGAVSGIRSSKKAVNLKREVQSIYITSLENSAFNPDHASSGGSAHSAKGTHASTA